jgi:AraC-like DNA-binding protein
MSQEAKSSAWIRLLETRDHLVFQLRHDVPSAWPDLVREFLDTAIAIPAPLPPGALLQLLADLARELDRLAARAATSAPSDVLNALDLSSATSLPVDAVCSRFEQAVRQWYTRLPPEALTSEVQALRVADYIDRHFEEPITLARLSQLSGCCSRQLSRAFRTSMRMSIREYLHVTRIDHAAERLRQGDKVESVLATVGWRGRKNFFRHFKDRIGTTPAQYRDNWMATSRRLEGAPALAAQSVSVHTSNCQSV